MQSESFGFAFTHVNTVYLFISIYLFGSVDMWRVELEFGEIVSWVIRMEPAA